MTAVQSLCQKAILMRGRKLIKSGAIQDIVNIYSSSGFGGGTVQEWNDTENAPKNEFV